MDANAEMSEAPGSLSQLARMVLPWIALAVLIAVLWTIASDFRRAQLAMSAQTQGSTNGAGTVATSAAGVATTGTAYVAKVQEAVTLRSQPNPSAEVVATAKVGSVLTILVSQEAWLRVKDAAGHVGWIPNEKRYITLQAK